MKYITGLLFVSILGVGMLSACQQQGTQIDNSKIQPAENKMNILPGNFTPAHVLINPPRAKDGFGNLSVQTIGSYNGLYKLLNDNGLTLGNVMRLRVSLAPDASGRIDYDSYMTEYKKYFGTKKVPVEPIHSIIGVRSLSTPGQLILLEADIAVPRKNNTASDKPDEKDK